MREVTVVEPIWLFEMAPHYYNWSGPPPPSAPPAAAPKPAAATVEARPVKQARN